MRSNELNPDPHGNNETVESISNNKSEDLSRAIKELVKKAYLHDGLYRGLREVSHKIESGDAQLCLLAKSCNEPRYVELIEALCQEHSVNIIRVEKSDDLADWCGLCKTDDEGNVRKKVKCSCAVITDLGEQYTQLSELKHCSTTI